MHCNATMAHQKLSSPDVTVTNKSDKEVQLPKIEALDEMVRSVMRHRTSNTQSSKPSQSSDAPASAVVGLVELMKECSLLDKLDAAIAWSEENGVDSIHIIKEVNMEADFVTALDLKKAPQKLLLKRLKEATKKKTKRW